MVDQSMPVQDAIEGRPPAGSTVMYSTDDPPVPYLIENRVIVSGENLVDAQASFDQRTNEPVVSFRFDSKGAQRFGQATQQNVGKLFAIILDDQVISAPQIREPILGGTGQISGNFTAEGANDLAVLLRAGALPATLTIVEERTVGPSLGADFHLGRPVRRRSSRHSRRRLHVRGLWHARHHCQYRAGGPRRDDRRGVVRAWRDTDLARVSPASC